MSKCHVTELQELWVAILTDAAHAFPTLEAEFERDLARLQKAVAHRGLRVFLEDLPAIGKHFDRCLSGGLYKLSGLPLTKRYSNTVVIPKFLRGLYLQIFYSLGQLKENCNVEAIFFVRQLTLAFKKGKLSCSSEANDREVVEFFDVDSGLPELEEFWGSDGCFPGASLPELSTPVESYGREADCQDREIDSGNRQSRENGVLDVNPDGARNGSYEPRPAPRGRSLGRETTYEGFKKSPLYHGRVSRMGSRKRTQLSVLLARLDFVSSLVTATLGSYDPNVWRFRHGPGAVSEYRGPSNKYCWTYWPDILETEYPVADYGFHSYSSWAHRIHNYGGPCSDELGSRLLCVPKTFKKPRLIAAEPCANQWCQQNLWHYFSRRTRGSWIGRFIRFNDQSLNQELCVRGSRDGTLATVDLSAASDRVSCHAVGQMFRKNPRLLNCLRACRTRFVSQQISERVPNVIWLRKFSTMGSACTFPIESLLFLSIAIAAVLTARGKRGTKKEVLALVGEVAVFGDDIVIPIDSRELLVEALEVLDFKVNTAKSYWTGKFRESCGIDAFRGVNVTPAYWRTFNDGKPESLASAVETSNNFRRKFLITAADHLASTVRGDIPRVSMRSGVFGIKSFAGPDLSAFKKRWNCDLQRDEVFVACLQGKQSKTPIEDDSALLQFFTEDPDPLTEWKSGVPQRPRLKIKPRWVAQSELYADAYAPNWEGDNGWSSAAGPTLYPNKTVRSTSSTE